jgi:hypothetical protein
MEIITQKSLALATGEGFLPGNGNGRKWGKVCETSGYGDSKGCGLGMGCIHEEEWFSEGQSGGVLKTILYRPL